MYLMQKCCVFCFAKNKDAALTFCWCWTFSFGKCDAEHFPLENVQHHILLCKMFSITFYFVKCSAKQNVTNAFDAKMHLMLPLHFVYKMLESGKMHFGNATQRVHFTKSNVQHHIFLCKMFSITFSNVKCSASTYILRITKRYFLFHFPFY